MMRSYSCWYEGAEGDAVMVSAWSPHSAALVFAAEHPSEPPRLINVARATVPWIWLYRVYIVRAVERVGKRYGAAPPPRITIQVEDRASAQLDQIAASVGPILVDEADALPPRRRERRSLSSLRRDDATGGASPAYRVVERLRQGPADGLDLRELLGLSREGATGVVMGLLREGWIRYRDQRYELAVELVEGEVTG